MLGKAWEFLKKQIKVYTHISISLSYDKKLLSLQILKKFITVGIREQNILTK